MKDRFKSLDKNLRHFVTDKPKNMKDFGDRLSNINWKKTAPILLAETALIGAAWACGNDLNNTPKEQNTSGDGKPADVVDNPEGLGPYSAKFINSIDPNFEKEIVEFTKDKEVQFTADDIEGFSIEYSGVASGDGTGKSRENFAIATNPVTGQQKLLGDTPEGIEVLFFGERNDETGEYFDIFNANGDVRYSVPKNHKEQYDINGSFYFTVYPYDYTLGKMPLFDKDSGLDVLVKSDGSDYEVSILNVNFIKEAPLPEGVISEFAESIKNSYDLKWNSDSTALELYAKGSETPVEGFSIDATDKNFPVWIYKYTFIGPEGYEPKDMTVDGTFSELKTSEIDGNVVFEIPGWRFIDGKPVRKGVIDPKGNELETPKYTTDEAVEMILQDSAKLSPEDLANPNSQARKETIERARALLGIKGNGGISSVYFEGLQFPTGGYFVGRNQIFISDNKGTVVQDKKTIFYAYEQLFNNNQSIVTWNKIRIIVDANLGKSDYPITIYQNSPASN